MRRRLNRRALRYIIKKSGYRVIYLASPGAARQQGFKAALRPSDASTLSFQRIMARIGRGLRTTLVICWLHLHVCLARFVFGVTPSGGLWRGETTTNKDDDVLENVHQMARASGGQHRGTISYDSFEENLLVHVTDVNSSESRVALVAPCAGQSGHQPPRVVIGRFTPVSHNDPYLLQCADDACGWTAFTYFYSEIYFLFVGRFGSIRNDTTVKVQLRAFDDCADQLYESPDRQGPEPSNASTNLAPFAVLNCSRLVATALEESYDSGATVRAGHHIAVEPIGNALHFFFQVVRSVALRNGSLHSVTQSLYRTTNFGRVSALYEAVEGAMAGPAAALAGHGGVAVQGELLCWAMLDRLHCASITDPIVEKQTLVGTGEAATRAVCVGTLSEHGTAIKTKVISS